MAEIDKLELDTFNNILDAAIENIAKNKNKKIEKAIISDTNTVELIGGKVNDKMIAITNEEGKVALVYSNAAICAKSFNINPTTVRQRASKEYVDDKKRKWSYIDANQYMELNK